MGNKVLRYTGLEFVMDFVPDCVVLKAIDKDMDVHWPITQLVQDHEDFATYLAPQLGGIRVVICAPLNHLAPRRLSCRDFNSNVDECIGHPGKLVI